MTRGQRIAPKGPLAQLGRVGTSMIPWSGFKSLRACSTYDETATGTLVERSAIPAATALASRRRRRCPAVRTSALRAARSHPTCSCVRCGGVGAIPAGHALTVADEYAPGPVRGQLSACRSKHRPLGMSAPLSRSWDVCASVPFLFFLTCEVLARCALSLLPPLLLAVSSVYQKSRRCTLRDT